MKILLVEDEKHLNNSITKLLKKNSFSVDSAFDGVEALDFINVCEYDVMVIDVMMPRLDGFSLIRKIREEGNGTAIIVLTARDSLEDKIKGLDIGADDYLVKPFEFDELLARIRALLRRNYRDIVNNVFELGEYKIDFSKKIVEKDGTIIELTSKEYEVLEYLARNKDRFLTREQIREHVWDFDYEGESNLIDVIIKNIRKKLGDKGNDSIIVTKRGVGYAIREK